ncbi:hypothetical protein F52700_2432 [Fusarium sp. NRRL 52700]|nr:hypothetical protein F52700_2432 [Fusarium sp. NRRL 52700]
MLTRTSGPLYEVKVVKWGPLGCGTLQRWKCPFHSRQEGDSWSQAGPKAQDNVEPATQVISNETYEQRPVLTGNFVPGHEVVGPLARGIGPSQDALPTPSSIGPTRRKSDATERPTKGQVVIASRQAPEGPFRARLISDDEGTERLIVVDPTMHPSTYRKTALLIEERNWEKVPTPARDIFTLSDILGETDPHLAVVSHTSALPLRSVTQATSTSLA